MNCPKCGCMKHGVVETRPSYFRPEWTQRRRQCAKCKHRWNTVELPTSDVIEEVSVDDKESPT